MKWTAMILTGGSSSRFGSDKSLAMLGESSLIEQLLSTLPLEIDVVIIGPPLQHTSRAVQYVREDLPGAGPVAAIHAGLPQISTEFVAIIATDMPFAALILDELIKNFPNTHDATIPLDAQGERQTLCAIYRVESLRNAIADLGSPINQSMRTLTRYLSTKELHLEPSLERILLDVDTPSDLERAIILSREIQSRKSGNHGQVD